MHWADASSLNYLRQVILQEDSGLTGENDERLQGIFVVASARPEWKGLELTGENLSSSFLLIPLAPLSDTVTRELAHELLENVSDVPDSVIELIVERAEGGTYFAEELVNYFLDRGIIDKSREPWRFLVGRLQESPLPTTLQHLLLTRLGALSPMERAALQRGAIFGRNFWTSGVQALGVPESERMLEPLQPRGFVETLPESALEGEREWSFHHALLREVTYESVLKRERALLHKKAGDWLEEQASRAGRLDEFAGLLGEHAERAGELYVAADWFVRAGERAFQQGASHEAKHFFDRALDLLPPVKQERRWRALAGREAALAVLGERDAQQADLKALLGLAEELQDDARRAEAWVREASAALQAGDLRGTLQAGEQAIAAAGRAGDEQIALRAHCPQAVALSRLGVAQAALQLLEVMVPQGRALGDDLSFSDALGAAANGISDTGDLARALELYKESADLARRCGNRFKEGI